MSDVLNALSKTARAISKNCFYENKELGVSQAIMLAATRDSNLIDRSNWQFITADMQEKFGDESPDSWYIERFDHWACGWLEYLIVNVYSYDVPEASDVLLMENDQIPALPSDVFLAMSEWLEKLEDYPLANDEHFSNLEYEEEQAYLLSEIAYLRRYYKLADSVSESDEEIVNSIMSHEDYEYGYTIEAYQALEKIMNDLNLLASESDEDESE